MAKQYHVTSKVRVMNSVVRFMSKRGKGPASQLAVTGRTSGERRVVVVTPVHIDDTTYIVAPYGAVAWVLNIRANPKVTLSRGGATFRFTAAEADKEEAGKVLARYYADNAKHVGTFMDIPGEHTIMDFTAVVDQYPVFKLS
jgi:deazaflavin-dependent oxidoreductase (nitroreductase family)